MRKVAPQLIGIPISEIARICQVSLKTATRWKAGTSCPPKTALMILEADLGCFDPAWRLWRVRGAWLVSPEAWEIKMTDVLSAPILRQRLAAYITELNRLKLAAEPKISDQPLPEIWPEWVFEKLA